jgi:hypothetical protein
LYQIAFWTQKPIREQILHIAKTENLSISQATNALVKSALARAFHEQQAATLPAIIQQAVSLSNRKLAARLVAILIRIAFDTGQTRVISTNILGRQPGMTEKNLKEVLSMGDKRTKTNLTRRTPQLKELEDILERYLLGKEGEDYKDNKERKDGRGK